MADDNKQAVKVAEAEAAARAAAAQPDTGMSGVLTQLRDALQGEQVAVQRRERDAIQKMLDAHDKRRDEMPKHTLVAVTEFMIADEENPEGRKVRMGEEFTVSEFDLPRYLGKGLPRANEPTEGGGVTVTQS